VFSNSSSGIVATSMAGVVTGSPLVLAASCALDIVLHPNAFGDYFDNPFPEARLARPIRPAFDLDLLIRNAFRVRFARVGASWTPAHLSTSPR